MIALVLGLALLGLLLYLLEKFVPMDPVIVIVIRVVIVICGVYYLASLFGFHDLAVPRIR